MATTNAADGTPIHYTRTDGPGRAVILVHGITESEMSWQPIVDRLSKQRTVITLDLRGHGQSGKAERYDLEAMASDVIAVAAACGLDTADTLPHIVGHSLGGAVVSAVGAATPVASIVNVDQSLQLGSFKEGLTPAEPMLRDPASFQLVIDGLFESMSGTMISASERERINALRRADQEVVLGVWELILTESEETIEATIEAALAGYTGSDVPYLALFGIDPGPDYARWLSGFISGAETELWADHGHYPHLVDPDRFVERLEELWAGAEKA